MEELKVGDRVKIADDSNDVRIEIAKFYGVFHVGRELYCGKVGRVVFKHTDRGNLLFGVTVPIIDSDGAFTWPQALLEKLPADGAGGKAMEYAAHRIVSDYMTTMCASKGIDLSHYPPAKCRYNIQIGPDPSPSTPGAAEIVFDHVTKDGKCMLQIAEIRGILSPDKLPEEYKKRSPRMDRVLDGLWVTDEGVARRYFVGQLLTEEEAAKLVKRMRACGKRLHDINVAARAKADEARLERWKAKGRKVVRI